jgi:hypothetical protein
LSKNIKIFQTGEYAGNIPPSVAYEEDNQVKLSWFERWFLKHSKKAWKNAKHPAYQEEDNRRGPRGPIEPLYASSNRSLNDRNSIDMSLFRADGGWIVQFTNYDDHRDRTNVHHFVIPDSEDFGQKLSEIITLQCLRQ